MSEIVLQANLRQRDAADSRYSVWVAASAGTGKTTVLTNRILRLLLAGTLPGRILCLTFTKAAAAEMANRLNTRLSRWTIAGDMDLSKDITEITGAIPESALVEHARRLFAQVLDTPGGMRILTIHAFCQSVLRRFPLEAGIPPQSEVMDDRSAAELLAESQAAVLNRARSGVDDKLAAALAEVTSHIHELGFNDLLRVLAVERGRLTRMIELAGGVDPYLARTTKGLGLKSEEDEAAIRRALAADAALDGAGLRRAAAVLARATAVTDIRNGEGLAVWLSGTPADRAAALDDYLGLFLTQKLEPRARLATKATLDANPWLDAVLRDEQQRVITGQQKLAAAIVNQATAALTRLSAAFLTAYETEKRRRALLDYDDLILITRALLDQPGIAPWVLFKLDGGIDHILIDEAQDTNPDQWQVVAALAEEFFVGEGASDVMRTIFAVGDAKQSIFSFQRADPREFLRMQRHFADRLEQATQRLHPVPLEISFRSTTAVLDVVDAVFARDEARDGVALDGAAIHHIAKRAGHAGRVELWPPIAPADAASLTPWPLPHEQLSAEIPRAQLARLIARTIARWLDTNELLPSKGRPVRPGDIMVLVRRRSGFVADLVRELKHAGVPVAGADRMVLTQQLAVMDLMAFGRFLLLPEDDLTLATVLKSPLIGLDEDQLYAVAHGRDGTLWQALRHHREPWAKAAAEELSAWLGRADYVPPHELYAELLGAGHGRKRLLGRLGSQAGDAIDEFLAQSLAYEQAQAPSLQGFLHWLDSSEMELKRDLDQGGRDEVRIMTVHGAKGLQAPIVFLPDTLSAPSQVPALLWPDDECGMIWAPRRGAGEPVATRAKAQSLERRDQEYRRLLYVALTRAEDRLYVCGWQTRRAGNAASWYHLVQDGMVAGARGGLAPIDVPPDCPGFADDGWVYDVPQTIMAEPDKPKAALANMADLALPRFATTDAPSEPAPPRPLIASRPSEAEPPPRSPLGADLDKQRFQRGQVIHRLMQTLPTLPPAEAEAAARRFLARPEHQLEPELQDEIARETLAVLRHPEFATLFGPSSRAEVSVVGLVGGRALSARIDRLVVTDDEVLVVDYKTNRPPPTERARVAPAYVEQLAAYRAALQQIYPGKRVRTLLLWTDGPSLMEIEPD